MVRTGWAAVALAIGAAQSVTWANFPEAIHVRLQQAGVDAASFAGFVARLDQVHAARVRDGDLDHLVFYALQSRHFTSLPPIEPALSARAFVASGRLPDDARARMAALLNGALNSADSDARLAYFRTLVTTTWPVPRDREPGLAREYERAMRFLYQKEFVAQKSRDPAESVASLYRARGFSTDTAVEADYVVYLALGMLKAMEPDRRMRRVLIVGPGLDLAPRTGFIDSAPPESYQPWAVIDALVSLRLSELADLAVVGADINPRVVDHLRREHAAPPVLHLTSGLDLTPGLTLEPDYRDYFDRLGQAIGASRNTVGAQNRRLTKLVQVDPSAARVLSAERLDVVTERLQGPSFDLVIATNILQYFDDTELAMALGNIAGMLVPGGILLHNEPRHSLRDIASAMGLAPLQSRQAPIALVTGAPPLVDTVFIHRRL